MMARQALDYRASPVMSDPDRLFPSQGIEQLEHVLDDGLKRVIRMKAICLALLAMCSVTGNNMVIFLPMPLLMRGTACNVVRRVWFVNAMTSATPPLEGPPSQSLQWCPQGSQRCVCA